METAFDIISLVLFIVVILLAFFRKVNVGVVAVTFGVIMVRIFGLTDKDLIKYPNALSKATSRMVSLTFNFE